VSTCLFCRIIDRSIPSTIVYEDEHALAFQDIHPQAPVHLLVIPRRHIQSVQELEGTDGHLLGHLVQTCVKLSIQRGLGASGYRIVTNSGPDAGQTVFHLHFHLLGGRPLGWPPG
jgi:histidine triad (HIT) family protein